MPSRSIRSAAAKTSGPSPAIASLNCRRDFGERGHEPPQLGASLLERQRAEILAVEKHQIEGHEDEPAAAERDCGFHRAEIRPAGLVEHHHLAVDHSRPAAELASGLNDRPISVRPIEPVAGERARRAVLDNEHRPVTVELDLVNPVLASGRLNGKAQRPV